jgi:hypothetical protein
MLLGVGGVVDAGDVPRVLDEHVLEAASSAEQRQPRLACEPDGVQRALLAAVGAARRDPEAVEACQPVLRPLGELVGGDPLRDDPVGQTRQGAVQGQVGLEGRVAVSYDRDAWSRAAQLATRLRWRRCLPDT